MSDENNKKPDNPWLPPSDWMRRLLDPKPIHIKPDGKVEIPPVDVPDEMRKLGFPHFDTGTLRPSMRIETNLPPPPDEETQKRIDEQMRMAMQQVLESMMVPPNMLRVTKDPQYVIVHIDDMVELSRLFRRSGQFLRRVKGRDFFNVYDSGPGDLYRMMSKLLEKMPPASMVIYVDTERRIERGKVIKLPKSETAFSWSREINLEREPLPENLLWRSYRYGWK